jgi:hypothetical protein
MRRRPPRRSPETEPAVGRRSRSLDADRATETAARQRCRESYNEGCLWVIGFREDGCPAFPEYGIECLKQIIRGGPHWTEARNQTFHEGLLTGLPTVTRVGRDRAHCRARSRGPEASAIGRDGGRRPTEAPSLSSNSTSYRDSPRSRPVAIVSEMARLSIRTTRSRPCIFAKSFRHGISVKSCLCASVRFNMMHTETVDIHTSRQ